MIDLLYFLVVIGIGVFLYLKKFGSDGPKDNQAPVKKVISAQTAQDFTLFEKVQDDMIMVDKYRYRAVLELKPINLAMYSLSEQLGIKERFRAAMIGVRHGFSFYLPSLRNNPERTVKQVREINQCYQEEEFKNLAIYGEEFARWIEWQAAYRSPLEPGYYMVINFDELKNPKGYSDEVLYQTALTELNVRCLNMISGLGRAEIKAKRLKTGQIHDLMYFVFNRELSEAVDFKQVEKSGVFGLYTTEKQPIFEQNEENVAAR